MAACGTNGGYHAHHRRDEEPCDACKDAHAADRRSRRIEQRAQAADTFLEALDTVPPIEGELDELEDLYETHRLIRADMLVAKNSRERASLAKVRLELNARIKALEAAAGAGKTKDPLDELQARRRARAASA